MRRSNSSCVFRRWDTSGFPEQEALSKVLMVRTLEENLAGQRFKNWEMPVNQMGGIHLELPQASGDVAVQDGEGLPGLYQPAAQVSGDVRSGDGEYARRDERWADAAEVPAGESGGAGAAGVRGADRG